jgi:hypothetical protein
MLSPGHDMLGPGAWQLLPSSVRSDMFIAVRPQSLFIKLR